MQRGWGRGLARICEPERPEELSPAKDYAEIAARDFRMVLLALGAGLAVAVPWYLGLFSRIRFTQVQVPKAIFVYTKHVGPYHTVAWM